MQSNPYNLFFYLIISKALLCAEECLCHQEKEAGSSPR